MPIRQPLQTPVRADDFKNKSLRFTVTPVAAQNSPGALAVGASVGQPALTVSHPALTFAETSLGRPSFLILTLAQQHTDTPVILSTDAPDYFQFATDSRPTFAPSLTLTPLPTGTYVHVRYAAHRAGLHQGILLIETPYDSRTVALRGRTRGLLPMLRTAQLPARQATRYVGRARSAGWRAGLLAVAIVGGLALGAYPYRCQLVPSLCSDGVADRILTKENQTPPDQLHANEGPKATALLVKSGGPAKPGAVPSVRRLPAVRKPLKAETLVQRPAPDSAGDQRLVASPVGMVRKSAGRPALTKGNDSKQAAIRLPQPATVGAVSEESELERELNRTGQDQQ